LREAAVALGMPQSYMIRKITWRAARVGLVTGLLLAVARVSGETAPLLFTALSNQFWSVDLLKTMANLPVTINNFINNPDPNWKRLAWAGALLITLAVLSLNIVARSLSGGRNPK
jgi:phosphate transport system permease protein